MISLRDSRVVKIIEWLESFFPGGAFMKDEIACKPVGQFLNNEKVTSLQFCMCESGFVIQNKLILPENTIKDLHLIKTDLVVIDFETMLQTIKMGSIISSPTQSMFLELKHVYTPLFTLSEWSSEIDPKLKNLFISLEDQLSSSTSSSSSKPHPLETKKIISPSKEAELWNRHGESNNESKLISDIFNSEFDFEEHFRTIFEKSLYEMVYGSQPFLHLLFNTLKRLLNTSTRTSEIYPISRFHQLVHTISKDLHRYLEKKLTQDLPLFSSRKRKKKEEMICWTDIPFPQYLVTLSTSIEICDQWISIRNKISSSSEEEDKGDIIKLLKTRLESIIKLRKIDEQTKTLLYLSSSSNKNNELSSAPKLPHFSEFRKRIPNPYFMNPYVNKVWKDCKSFFSSSLQKDEEIITQKIKGLLSSTTSRKRKKKKRKKSVDSSSDNSDNWNLFLEFRSLILGCRGVFLGLSTERNKLLESIQFEINLRMREITNLEVSSSSSKEHCFKKCRSVEMRISKLYDDLKNLFSDLSQRKKLEEEVKRILKRLKTMKRKHLEDWEGQAMAHVREVSGSSLSLRGLVQFHPSSSKDSNGSKFSIHVIWKEMGDVRRIFHSVKSLLQFISGEEEKRSLSELKSFMKRYSEFMSRYTTLGRIFHFLNHLFVYRVLPCQTPLILEHLSDMKRVVDQFSSSSNSSELEYLSQLRSISHKCGQECSLITSFHDEIRKEVSELFHISLLTGFSEWKKRIGNIRTLFSTLKSTHGFKDSAMIKWKQYWDFQLLKILDVQYRQGLQTLITDVDEVKESEDNRTLFNAELIYKKKLVQFSPPLSEIHKTYFSRIQNFVSIPYLISGFSNEDDDDDDEEEEEEEEEGEELLEEENQKKNLNNNSSIFISVIEKNEDLVSLVYSKFVKFMKQLQLLKRKYSREMLLQTVHLDDIIMKKFSIVKDWEVTYSKNQIRIRNAVDKIPDSITISPYIFSMESIKEKIEEGCYKLETSLALTLQKSAEKHLKEIEDFIQKSTTALDIGPQNVEDIAESNKLCLSIVEKKKMIEEQFELFFEKNAVLKNISGSSTLNAEDVKDKWVEFETRIYTHSRVLNEKSDEFKVEIQEKLEVFEKQMEKFLKKIQTEKKKKGGSTYLFENMSKARKELERISQDREEFQSFQARAENLIKQCQAFSIFHVSLVKILESIDQTLKKRESHWEVFRLFYLEIEEYRVEDWINFQKKMLSQFETSFLGKWTEQLKKSGSKINKSIKKHLGTQITKYQKLVDHSKYLLGKGWTAEHWLVLGRYMGLPSTEKLTIDSLLFGTFLDYVDGILAHIKDIRALNARAYREDQIRKALYDLKVWENTHEFEMIEHFLDILNPSENEEEEDGEEDDDNERNNMKKNMVPLIREWKDVMNKVGDHYSLLSSLKSSKYIDKFGVEVETWESKITKLNSILTLLLDIQRKWVYLAPIFLRGALPALSHKFGRSDSKFRELMFEIYNQEKRVVKLARKRDLIPNLKSVLENLNACQKALQSFLEQKRRAFPRFYFIGDSDLLQILGQARNPRVIQVHLKKLFAGIQTVVFGEKNQSIISIRSSEGENVDLSNTVNISNKKSEEQEGEEEEEEDNNNNNIKVEEWLTCLDTEMKKTLSDNLINCINSTKNDGCSEFRNLEFITKYPEQILSLCLNIIFTRDVENIRNSIKGNLNDVVSRNVNKLLTEYAKILSDDRQLSHLEDIKLKSLMIDLIHQRDVISTLSTNIKNNNNKEITIQNWSWQKQLRYYFNSKKNICTIQMCKANFFYGYEYQGNKPRLVYTPLTDQCYLTLTQSLYLGLGGNPYGPAGTGKTESVKSLGVVMGRQVLVFNCDEGIDFQAMGRLFTGLVRCGAWGCFDEFNRLQEAQLSVISQQIQVIQSAIQNKKRIVKLLGREVKVDDRSGIFVTMNPASRRYGARSKLPGNLKRLFRSVAMARPDIELIARAMLLCEGFSEGDILARKMRAVFSLSEQRLSSQQHYDWGLRAMKTVLKIGGGMMKKIKKSKNDNKKIIINETEMIISALRTNTLPKLTELDAPLFEDIVKDVFQKDLLSSSSNNTDDNSLISILKEIIKEKHLVIENNQIEKILNFEQSLEQRMGVVLVGPSGSGKSTIWKLLHEALERQQQKIQKYVVTPKSISRETLLGFQDVDTREFNEGIITSNARKIVQSENIEEEEEQENNNNNNIKKNNKSWIVCDGDIDPKWIEALNSVLDDNRLLTLPTGERIQFSENVNFIFETHDLQYASPATISRMGMIFCSPIDVKHVFSKWMGINDKKLSSGVKKLIKMCFWKCYNEIFRRRKKNYNIIFNNNNENNKNKNNSDSLRICVVRNSLQSILGTKSKKDFAKRLYIGFSSFLTSFEDRFRFKKFVYKLCKEKMEDEEEEGEEEEIIIITKLIKTKEIEGLIHQLKEWLNSSFDESDNNNNNCILLVSQSKGCGMNLLLNECLNTEEEFEIITLPCHSGTNSQEVIQKIENNCSIVYTQNKGKICTPSSSKKRLILVLKDVDVPSSDQYGTTQFISFLRQLVSYQGYYNHKNLEWIWLDFSKIKIICTMHSKNNNKKNKENSSGNNNNNNNYDDNNNNKDNNGGGLLSPRFTSIVPVLCIPSPTSLTTIISPYINSFLDSIPVQQISIKYCTSKKLILFFKKMFENIVVVSTTINNDNNNNNVAAGCYYPIFKDNRFNEKDLGLVITFKDLIRWITGLQKDYDLGEILKSEIDLIRLIAFEGRRSFQDKLLNRKAKEEYLKIEKKMMVSCLGILKYEPELNSIYSSLSSIIITSSQKKKKNKKINNQQKQQQQLLKKGNLREFAKMVNDGMKTYGRQHRKLSIPLLSESLIQISKIDRWLSSGQSLLFCGRPGLGTKSMVSLFCFFTKKKFFTPVLATRRKAVSSFKKEMKKVFRWCGIQCKDIVMMIEDHQIHSNWKIMEMIHYLLTTSEIPNLYKSKEEFEQLICSTIREQKEEKKNKSSKSTTSTSEKEIFYRRIKKHLRIVLSLDPRGKDFQAYLRSFPSFTSCTRILWKENWTTIGLSRIPKVIIGKGLLATIPKSLPLNIFLKIHNFVATDDGGQQQRSPKDLLSFLENFKMIYKKFMRSKKQELGHLTLGLSKIIKAEKLVDEIRKNAQQKKKRLDEKQNQASQAMTHIREKMNERMNESREIEKLGRSIKERELVLAKKTAQIESKLKNVQPKLEEARTQVNTIETSDLIEIRNYPTPRQEILHVLEGVVRVMGRTDTRLKAMKGFLGERGVIYSIIHFDPIDLPAPVFQAVRQHIRENQRSFDTIERHSLTASKLAQWLVANIGFLEVYQEVRPWEEEKEKLARSSEQLKRNLIKCKESLSKLNSSVESLHTEFDKKTKEAAQLKADLKEETKKLTEARSMLKRLYGEKKRWYLQRKEKIIVTKKVPVFSVLSAAFITYLGSENEDSRKLYLSKWINEFLSSPKKIIEEKKQSSSSSSSEVSEFDVCQFLKSEKEILEYRTLGLPTDTLSTENAVILLESEKVPFIIDPSNRIKDWLRKLALNNNNSKQQQQQQQVVECIPLHHPKLINSVELAMRFGKTLMITEVDRIESVFFPYLKREIQISGTRKSVIFGEKTVDLVEEEIEDNNNNNQKNKTEEQEQEESSSFIFNNKKGFKLFFFSRDVNVEIPPDIEPYLTKINFSVTKSGLEEQLLNTVFDHRFPLEEQKKRETLKEEETCRLELLNLEKKLLDVLAASKGSILENQELKESLGKIKGSAEKTAKKLKISRLKKKGFAKLMDKYRPLANLASNLFFLIKQLKKLRRVYQFDHLETFIHQLFLPALLNDHDDDDDDQEDQEDQDNNKKSVLELKKNVYYYVSRGVFKQHRSMVGMYLLYGLVLFRCEGDDEILNEYRYLLGLSSSSSSSQLLQQKNQNKKEEEEEIDDDDDHKIPSFIPKHLNKKFNQFKSSFPKLFESCKFNEDSRNWENWISSFRKSKNIQQQQQNEEEEYNNINIPNSNQITPLQKLLIVDLLIPEKRESFINKYLMEQFKIPSITPPTLDYSDPCHPNILFLTLAGQGTDPSVSLESYINHSNNNQYNKFHQIALGKGKIESVKRLIRVSMEKGNWVLLKNLHLVPLEFLKDLEQLLEQQKRKKNKNEEEERKKKKKKKKQFRIFMTTEVNDNFPILLLKKVTKITYEAPPGLKQNLLGAIRSSKSFFLNNNNNNKNKQQNQQKQKQRLIFPISLFHSIVQERRSYIPQGWSTWYEFNLADLKHALSFGKDVCVCNNNNNKITVDWETIRGIFDVVVYGARMENSFDRRILKTYLNSFFQSTSSSEKNKNILRDKYFSFFELEKILNDPKCCFDNNNNKGMIYFHDLLIRWVERELGGSEQLLNPVRYFGLPRNLDQITEITTRRNNIQIFRTLTMDLFINNNIKQKQTTSSNNNNNNNNNNSLFQFWQKLIHPYIDLVLQENNSSSSDNNNNNNDPLQSFVNTETIRANSLLRKIHSTFRNFEELLLLSNNNNNNSFIIQSFREGRVPNSWIDDWEEGAGLSRDIHTWLNHIVRKTVCLNKMNNNNNSSSSSSSKCYDLSAFFRPQIFLNVLKQRESRRSGIAMDELSNLDVLWDNNNTNNDDNNGYIALNGMKVQGGILTKTGKLIEVHETSPAVSDCNIFFVKWISQSSSNNINRRSTKRKKNSFGLFPVYFTSKKEKVLMEISIDISEKKLEEWIFASVSFLIDE